MPYKVLFVTDHVFHIAEETSEVYTVGGKFPYSGWKSYLEIFDSIKVVGRGKPKDARSKLSLASGSNVEFETFPAYRAARRLTQMPAMKRQIKKLVNDSDVVIARLPSELGLIACNYARQLNKPYLVEMVACAWDSLWNHGSLAAKVYAPIFMFRNRRVVANAPVTRYVTKKFLQHRYPTKGFEFVASNVLINNTSIKNKVRPSEKGDRVYVLGTIGSLNTKLKGVETALKALAAINDDLSGNYQYRILGEGDSTQLIEVARKLGIQDKIHFDGLLPAGDEVLNWLSKIDLYLQPSLQEGLPRALIEALNVGCLAIGSTAGGIPELLDTHRLHKPNDARGLSTRIIETLALSPEAAEEERQHNTVVAKSYYQESIYQNRIDSLLKLKSLLIK